jgi:NADH-quinone oxidoreductase subunit N
MFIATIPVISYVYVFVKLYISVFSELSTFYTYMLYILAILSMSLGVFGALVQRRIKRLIAYSSISTIGYIIAGISGDSILLTQQSLLYLFIYIINIVPLFIIVLNYRINNVQCLDSIRQFSALYSQNSFFFSMMCLFLFSLAGVPPLAGFFGKLLLFTAFGSEAMFMMLFISISFTLIGCYYYIRIIKMVLYDKNQTNYFFATTSY